MIPQDEQALNLAFLCLEHTPAKTSVRSRTALSSATLCKGSTTSRSTTPAQATRCTTPSGLRRGRLRPRQGGGGAAQGGVGILPQRRSSLCSLPNPDPSPIARWAICGCLDSSGCGATGQTCPTVLPWLACCVSRPGSALSLERGMPLYTFNLKHYRMFPGLEVCEPYARAHVPEKQVCPRWYSDDTAPACSGGFFTLRTPPP